MIQKIIAKSKKLEKQLNNASIIEEIKILIKKIFLNKNRN